MTKVLMLTKSFPWPGGDDFLLAEINAWQLRHLQIVVAPEKQPTDALHDVPGIEVDLTRCRRSGTAWRVAEAVRTCFSRELWAEMRSAPGPALRSPTVWAHCIKAVSRYRRSLRSIRLILRQRGPFDLIYCYWRDSEAFAATQLRGDAGVVRVVARAHGYDLYPTRHPHGVIPLARRFAGDFDLVAPVSAQGRREHIRQGGDPGRTTVARLGVALPEKPSCPSVDHGTLSIVSVSHCVPVKRLERIVDALAILQRLRPTLRVSWTHIGDGPTRNRVEQHADDCLSDASRLTWRFTGHLSPAEVHHLLRRSQFDLIVNVSASEGVPVSLMEAMSYGIPAVATNVGGVSELVDPSCGWLLPADPSPERIARGLLAAYASPKSEEVREAARNRIAERFSAETNHRRFVDECLALLDSPV